MKLDPRQFGLVGCIAHASQQNRKDWCAWLETLPAPVRKLAIQYPPMQTYAFRTSDPPYPTFILAYNEAKRGEETIPLATVATLVPQPVHPDSPFYEPGHVNIVQVPNAPLTELVVWEDTADIQIHTDADDEGPSYA